MAIRSSVRDLIWSVTAVLLIAVPLRAGAPEIQEALKRGKALEAAGEVERAISLYRALYKRHPRRTDVLYRLEALLSKAGSHREAAGLLRNHLSRSPRDVTARLRLGDALFSLGEREEAFKQWERVIGKVRGLAGYALVAERYKRHNLLAEAERIYLRGRETLGPPTLYARQLAELAERQADYGRAVSEYLLYLEEKPGHLALIEPRFREFAREGVARELILTKLTDEVRRRPKGPGRRRLLTGYAVGAGRAEVALAVLLEHPGEAAVDNPLLVRIGSHALRTDDWETASSAYETLIARTTDNPVASLNLLLALAQVREGQNRVEDALQIYNDLIDRHSRPVEADEARYRLGRLLRDSRNDLEAAQEVFGRVAEGKRWSPWRYRSLAAIGEIAVRKGDLDGARSAYARIVRERPDEEEGWEARFRIAECSFFDGDFENARGMLAKVLTGPTTGFALNDALSLLEVIDRSASSDPRALENYAGVLKLVRQGQHARALEHLLAFLERYPSNVLTDRCLALQGELLDALGQHREAIGAYQMLLDRVPWSPICPSSRMEMARITSDRLGLYQDAIDIYEQLLVDYPKSVVADEARDRLRTLQRQLRELRPSTRKEAG
ncbi:MAG: tetratricopeptide repeat protein [Candidatus Latescibacteria bacterium]|jgi:tetratricopeptide (TPR) repeat protein|nr:tetratricopeptide repeat protein [Candidatus Latescibacterota bacterium]